MSRKDYTGKDTFTKNPSNDNKPDDEKNVTVEPVVTAEKSEPEQPQKPSEDVVVEEKAKEAPVHDEEKVVKKGGAVSKVLLVDEDGLQLGVFENRVLWVSEHGSVAERHVLTVLQNYVKVGMESVDLNVLAIEQQRLWRLFEYIHNQPSEFDKLYGLVIEFAVKYKEELFEMSMLFRAQSSLTLSVDQLQAFNNLRTLIINTISTRDRSKVKALIDIRKIVEHDSIPEHIRGMYVAYYN